MIFIEGLVDNNNFVKGLVLLRDFENFDLGQTFLILLLSLKLQGLN